jgi:hypothetical protein
MGYNPLVAKDVKITTWIKEFDGEEPVAPIFPAEGDCFIVFATDEDATTHNALSSKTYANGEWVDAEGGSTPTGTIKITENGEHDVSSYATADVDVSGGGGGDFNTAEVTIAVADGYSSFGLNCYSGDEGGYVGIFGEDDEFYNYCYVESDTSPKTFKLLYGGDSVDVLAFTIVTSVTGDVTYDDTGKVTISGDCTITGYSDD